MPVNPDPGRRPYAEGCVVSYDVYDSDLLRGGVLEKACYGRVEPWDDVGAPISQAGLAETRFRLRGPSESVRLFLGPFPWAGPEAG